MTDHSPRGLIMLAATPVGNAGDASARADPVHKVVDRAARLGWRGGPWLGVMVGHGGSSKRVVGRGSAWEVTGAHARSKKRMEGPGSARERMGAQAEVESAKLRAHIIFILHCLVLFSALAFGYHLFDNII